MSLVVDASVAFKWFVPEIDDEHALTLLDAPAALRAPDLIFGEIGNAMWVRLRKQERGREAALAAQAMLCDILDEVDSAADLIPRAVEIGFELNHAIYDCIYLALCEREGLSMVTADDRLLAAIANTPFAPLAHPLIRSA